MKLVQKTVHVTVGAFHVAGHVHVAVAVKDHDHDRDHDQTTTTIVTPPRPGGSGLSEVDALLAAVDLGLADEPGAVDAAEVGAGGFLVVEAAVRLRA